tara:strand:+ start:291 stop:611 length:321 start_codon:yes stop_codon:yes gene_type:complete
VISLADVAKGSHTGNGQDDGRHHERQSDFSSVTSLEVSVADHVALVDWIQNRVNNHAADQSANGDSLPSCRRIQFHDPGGKSEFESRIESSKFVCPPMGHDEVLLE